MWKETLVAVGLYWFVSLSLIFSNKTLMSSWEHSIPAPLFVTWVQCVQTAALIWGLGMAKEAYPQVSLLAQFPKPQAEVSTLRAVAPLSVVFVGMIASNNVTLMHIPVSFYNVAKALSVVFNVVLGYYVLGSVVSRSVLATLAVVVAGFLVGTTGELQLTMTGVVFGIISSVMSPLNSIMTKKILPVVNQDKWILALNNNINASLLFIPLLFVFGEIPVLAQHMDTLLSPQYWLVMLASGFLGFAIGIVVVMVVKATSPLTFCLVGVLKNSVQTVLGVYIYGTPMSPGAVLGVALVLTGSLLYTYVRTKESAQESLVLPVSEKDAPPSSQISPLSPLSPLSTPGADSGSVAQ